MLPFAGGVSESKEDSPTLLTAAGAAVGAAAVEVASAEGGNAPPSFSPSAAAVAPLPPPLEGNGQSTPAAAVDCDAPSASVAGSHPEPHERPAALTDPESDGGKSSTHRPATTTASESNAGGESPPPLSTLLSAQRAEDLMMSAAGSGDTAAYTSPSPSAHTPVKEGAASASNKGSVESVPVISPPPGERDLNGADSYTPAIPVAYGMDRISQAGLSFSVIITSSAKPAFQRFIDETASMGDSYFEDKTNEVMVRLRALDKGSTPPAEREHAMRYLMRAIEGDHPEEVELELTGTSVALYRAAFESLMPNVKGLVIDNSLSSARRSGGPSCLSISSSSLPLPSKGLVTSSPT